jgi:hypothetical protein
MLVSFRLAPLLVVAKRIATGINGMFEQLGEAGSNPVLNAFRLRTAQAKWERLSTSDYEEIQTIPDLIAKVAERYSLPHERAKNDVEIWAREMRF